MGFSGASKTRLRLKLEKEFGDEKSLQAASEGSSDGRLVWGPIQLELINSGPAEVERM